MGRRDEYLNYRSGSRRRRGGGGGNPIAAIVAVLLVGLACGFTAYHLAKGNLGERLSGNQLTNFLQGGATPTAVAEISETPAPATPTPTAIPTGIPTPYREPMMYEPKFLEGFTDTREKVEVRGIYAARLTLKSSKLQHYLDLADSTELNAIVIDVKCDDGTISYQMDCESVIEAGTIRPSLDDNHTAPQSLEDMKALINLLHEHGIYVIARIVCFRDEALLETHEDWFLHTFDGPLYKDGDGRTWVNPYNELATRYIIDVACQAAKDGFDEICFDYIRCSTYNSMKNVYFSNRLIDYYTLSDQIAEFTKYACNRLKPLGVFVSASVYGIVINSKVDADRVGQNYGEMAKYLDYICPMIYPSHYAETYAGIAVPDADPYALISYEIKSSNKKLAAAAEETDLPIAECRPWLQSFTASWIKGHITYTNPVIRKQVEACYDNGIDHWMYWNAAGNYDEEAFEKK